MTDVPRCSVCYTDCVFCKAISSATGEARGDAQASPAFLGQGVPSHARSSAAESGSLANPAPDEPGRELCACKRFFAPWQSTSDGLYHTEERCAAPDETGADHRFAKADGKLIEVRPATRMNVDTALKYADDIRRAVLDATGMRGFSSQYEERGWDAARDALRQLEERTPDDVGTDNREAQLERALRGVLEHYHAPCHECWDALKEAYKSLGIRGRLFMDQLDSSGVPVTSDGGES